NFAVSPEGGALVTGVCKPADGSSSCKPNAPILLRVEQGALHAMGHRAPQLSGLALLPAFSADGRSAYFLGRRGKDDRINLFVSRDGGEAFLARTLEWSAGPRPARHPHDEDEEPSEPEGPETFEFDDNSALRPGDDG